MRRLLSAVVVAALLVPVAASAVTVEELTAQIQALLQQVTALQQQVSTTQPVGGVTPSVQCPYISRDLKPGMSGDDVARLQQFLALDPTIYPEAKVTGYYGPLTEAAVRRFQCKNKIACSAIGSKTIYRTH